MLKKQFRIRKQKEFDLIFKKGRKIKTRFLLIVFRENGLKSSRFAFIVSSKVSKKAVVRNKIKRRLREIIRLNFSKIRPGYDFIIVASPHAKEVDFHGLEQDLKTALIKNKLLI
jgi:ribonuclease P protein component